MSGFKAGDVITTIYEVSLLPDQCEVMRPADGTYPAAHFKLYDDDWWHEEDDFAYPLESLDRQLPVVIVAMPDENQAVTA